MDIRKVRKLIELINETGVAEIEIQTAVGAEVKGVNTVIVLRAIDLGEHQFLAVLVGDAVAIAIVEGENIVACGDDHAVAENADAMGGVDVGSLIKYRRLVGLTVADGVFQDNDPVALSTFALVAAVVDDFANPDSTLVIDIDRARA